MSIAITKIKTKKTAQKYAQKLRDRMANAKAHIDAYEKDTNDQSILIAEHANEKISQFWSAYYFFEDQLIYLENKFGV